MMYCFFFIYLSTGTYYIAYNTIHLIVYETCEAIWKTFHEEFMPCNVSI